MDTRGKKWREKKACQGREEGGVGRRKRERSSNAGGERDERRGAGMTEESYHWRGEWLAGPEQVFRECRGRVWEDSTGNRRVARGTCSENAERSSLRSAFPCSASHIWRRETRGRERGISGVEETCASIGGYIFDILVNSYCCNRIVDNKSSSGVMSIIESWIQAITLFDM